ncbi:GNAT family N-acetyltransferase [Sphingomonas oryzagri]
MQIRPENPADEEPIRAVITSAFLKAEHSDGNEASIVDELRSAGVLTISLVAANGGAILGHVAFSPVMIDGVHDGWFGLGPVSVNPNCQREGVGTALIEAGLTNFRRQGLKGCVVLGDPAYYRRFGFAFDPDLRLAGVPPEYFQQLSFDDRHRGGIVTYHPAFSGG